MPAPIDQFVEDRLSDPDFYPDKDEETRENIAWGIGWKQYKASHPKWKSKAEKAKAKKKRKSGSDSTVQLLRMAASLDSAGLYAHADSLDRIAAWLRQASRSA